MQFCHVWVSHVFIIIRLGGDLRVKDEKYLVFCCRAVAFSPLLDAHVSHIVSWAAPVDVLYFMLFLFVYSIFWYFYLIVCCSAVAFSPLMPMCHTLCHGVHLLLCPNGSKWRYSELSDGKRETQINLFFLAKWPWNKENISKGTDYQRIVFRSIYNFIRLDYWTNFDKSIKQVWQIL